jgi:hypothetical protein
MWELVKIPRIQRYLNYSFAKAIVAEIGITHYAFNIIIYLSTGKAFRMELKRFFAKGLCGKVTMSISKEYSSLRSSIRRDGSKSQAGKKSMYVSVNGHTTNTTVVDTPPPTSTTTTTIVSEPVRPTVLPEEEGEKDGEAAPLTTTPTTTKESEGVTDNGIDTSETNV